MCVDMRARVLVVDDQSFNRVILGRMLAKLGLEVVEAENGQVALELFLSAVQHTHPAADAPPPAQQQWQGAAAAQHEGVEQRDAEQRQPQQGAQACSDSQQQQQQQRLAMLPASAQQPAAKQRTPGSQPEQDGGRPESSGCAAACAGAQASRSSSRSSSASKRRAVESSSGQPSSSALYDTCMPEAPVSRPSEQSDSCGGALQDCQAAPVAFILLDLQMPVLNGWRFAAQLRQLEQVASWRRVPIVACTALTGDAAATALTYGVDELMEKPPSITKLQTVLAKHNVWSTHR